MKITAYNLGRKCNEEIDLPVIGTQEDTGLPILGIKMMSDEKWIRLCEEQERKHPELYTVG